jgi:hypothetical protein
MLSFFFGLYQIVIGFSCIFALAFIASFVREMRLLRAAIEKLDPSISVIDNEK